jgi:acetyltransferase-like isoleucine patch superfamily enzyme
MTGSQVYAGAEVVDSVLGPRARVGRAVRLAGVTVGDDAVLDPGAVLEPGRRVDCGAVVAASGAPS